MWGVYSLLKYKNFYYYLIFFFNQISNFFNIINYIFIKLVLVNSNKVTLTRVYNLTFELICEAAGIYIYICICTACLCLCCLGQSVCTVVSVVKLEVFSHCFWELTLRLISHSDVTPELWPASAAAKTHIHTHSQIHRPTHTAHQTSTILLTCQKQDCERKVLQASTNATYVFVCKLIFTSLLIPLLYVIYTLHVTSYYIYIYAFSRRFYPKWLTVHSGYTFVSSVL